MRLIGEQKHSREPLDYININPLRPAGKLISAELVIYKIEPPEELPVRMNNLWTGVYAISRTGIKVLLSGFKRTKYDFSNPRAQVDYAISYAALSNANRGFYALGHQSLSFHSEENSNRQTSNGKRDVQ